MNNRITPENITQLKENEIFCFGSNEAGFHGAGAAKLALNKFGAIYGQGFGIQRKSFAIPTKDNKIETLPLNHIQEYVLDFIDFAKRNPNLIFLVTKIGTGLVGLKTEEIAPMFRNAINVKNIYLPKEFWDILVDNKQ